MHGQRDIHRVHASIQNDHEAPLLPFRVVSVSIPLSTERHHRGMTFKLESLSTGGPVGVSLWGFLRYSRLRVTFRLRHGVHWNRYFFVPFRRLSTIVLTSHGLGNNDDKKGNFWKSSTNLPTPFHFKLVQFLWTTFNSKFNIYTNQLERNALQPGSEKVAALQVIVGGIYYFD